MNKLCIIILFLCSNSFGQDSTVVEESEDYQTTIKYYGKKSVKGIALNFARGAGVHDTKKGFWIMEGIGHWPEKWYGKKVKVTGMLCHIDKTPKDSSKTWLHHQSYYLFLEPKYKKAIILRPKQKIIGEKDQLYQ